MRKLEVIALNAKDAKDAELAGADRIELVSAMSVGGLSPKLEVVKEVVKEVSIPVNVMVRYESDSFVYSKAQFELLLKYIEEVKKLGINGIVFGSLTASNLVDIEQLNQVLTVAEDMDVTYHRAIDQCDATYEYNFDLIDGKATTVLTSGGIEHNIVENLSRIDSISNSSTRVLVGGGINLDNYKQVISSLQNCDFHIGSLAYNNGDFKAGINMEIIKELKGYIQK